MLWLKIKNDFHTVITVLRRLPYLSFRKLLKILGKVLVNLPLDLNYFFAKTSLILG